MDIVLATTSLWTHGCVQHGIRTWIEQHALPWRLQPIHRASPQRPERCDGLIVVSRRGMEEEVGRLQRTAPAVHLAPGPRRAGASAAIGFDEAAIGALAARHFHELGYRSGLTVGRQVLPARRERYRAFAATAAALGMPVHHFDPGRKLESVAAYDALLLDLMTRLPQPIGAFLHQDLDAVWFIGTCQRLGIDVPRTLGVLGVDNDIAACEAIAPRLSSVAPPWLHLGRLAALHLQRLLSGAAGEAAVSVAPVQVVQRESTGRVQSPDRLVARVEKQLLRRFAEPLTVDGLAAAVGVSRSTLQHRYRRARGVAINRRLHQVRMVEARRLLLETGRSVADIAAACGYGTCTRFIEMFKQHHGGMTPGRFRESA